jgi:hypothetical protein
VDFGFVLEPLRYAARLRAPRGPGGRSGAVIFAVWTMGVWLVKVAVFGYAAVVVVAAYLGIGLAWLLAPVVAVVTARVRHDPLAPTVGRYRSALGRSVRRLNDGLSSLARR